MRIFDKVSITILVIILIIVSVTVLILQSIRPDLIAYVDIKCRQINFELKPLVEANQPVLLLHNNLWIKEARIDKFDRIRIKAAPSIQNTELDQLAPENIIIISPRSSSSYVKIKSELDAFSISDLFIKSAVNFSFGILDSGFHIELQKNENTDNSEYVANFSLGDTIYLSLLNCEFLDRDENRLYQTNTNIEEIFAFPVSLVQPYLVAMANSGILKFEAEWQIESLSKDVELIKDIEISNINYYMREYILGGKIKEQNTVLSGKVRRIGYSSDDSVNIRKDMVIKAQPQEAKLNYLTASSSSIEAHLLYKVRSLRLVQDKDVEHELVKSKLELLMKNKTLVAIYSLSIIVFGIVLNLLIKKM